MAKVTNSHIDEAALREWLQANAELANALNDVADEVADGAVTRVKGRAQFDKDGISRGVGYKVKTKIVNGRTDDNPLTAIVYAPAGAFLGTKTGERRQVFAWGHKGLWLHGAEHYDLADSADSLFLEGE